jgi:hypothetical protein
MVLKGLDPRSASLVRDNLNKVAQEMEEMACDEKKAQAEKEKADAAKKAQEMEEMACNAKKAVDEEIEKKAKALNAAFVARFKRGMRIISKRFALNIEPCHLKYNFGEVLSSRHEASGYSGMDGGLVRDIVERGFNHEAAMVKTADQLVKRAQEICAMPDDALAAIEADADEMSPVMPATASEEEEMGRQAQSELRRRASNGSLPVIRSSESVPLPAQPTKQDAVRSALSGGLLERRYVGR